MFKRIVHKLFEYLINLNVYVAANEDTIEKQRKQIIATRVFILLFIVSLVSLVGYTSLSLQLTTVNLQYPSQSTFERLESIYPNTLVCPCSQTSIQADKFIHFNVSYHQICSSMFVSDEWISSISHSIPQSFYLLDIRRMISSQLQLLASQCHSSKLAVTDALKTLESSQLFISTMLSRYALDSQVDIVVGEVKKNAIAEQNQSRGLIQNINQQNQLVSALGSNFMYANSVDNDPEYYVVKFLTNWTYPPAIDFSGYSDSQLCSCLDSSNCTYPSGIYQTLTGYDSFLYQGIITPPVLSSIQIPGLYVGCMPLDAIMQSTLECFYRNDCLSLLFDTANIKALDSSVNSTFPIDSKIRVLIENLFVEDWLSEGDFQSFFKECQPNKCSYSYNARGNVAFVITTILSLIGGLFVALKIIATVLVNIFQVLEKMIKTKSSSSTQNDSSAINTEVSSGEKAFDKIREWIVNFNLFKHSYNNDHGRRNEIFSTRIYVLLMIVGVVVIVFYGSIIEHTLTYHIKTPSLDSYRELVDEYPSFRCECEQITAAYSVFISLSPTFHQICSSIFVEDAFIPRYQDTTEVFSLRKFNLRIATASYYSSGRLLCALAKDTSSEAINTFLQTIYVSAYLTHEDEFLSRMKAFVNNFETLAPTTFNHLLYLILLTTQGNQLLTGSFTNAELQYNVSPITEQNVIDVLWINPNDESCSCGMSLDSCALSYDQYCNYTYRPYIDGFNTACYSSIPGLTISCYVMNGVLISSPACFYDLDCVTSLIWRYANNLNTSLEILIPSSFILNKNITSRFYVNSSSADILNLLGIENWNEKINYSLYYYNCKPINCLYTTTKHFHIPTIVTIVISLIGGVSVILRIVIPLIVKLIRRPQRVQINAVRIVWQESQIRRFVRNLTELNLFKTVETDRSNEIRRDQIISTRIYITLWIISVGFLSIYTGLSKETVTILVNSPSITVVNDLQSQDLNEFSCPCSNITIPFQAFTSINFTLHQICSSDFVSNSWLEGLFKFSNKQLVSAGVLSSHFQLLRLFCQSSNETLFDATASFYANQFISVNLLTQNEFKDQIQTFINQFQAKTISSFRRNLALIVDISVGNQLISVYETNWHFIPDPQRNISIYTKSQSYESGNCSCGSLQSSFCIDSFMINENTSVPGMMIGCLPLTSLRLSTLQCFYDQKCLDTVKYALNLANVSINPLNSSRSSAFSVNTTLDDVIDTLMLEEWTNNTDYNEYFNQCNLQQCSYSKVKENNPLVIFTKLLGFYGGLTIALDWIAVTIVKNVRKLFNKCQPRRKTAPETF